MPGADGFERNRLEAMPVMPKAAEVIEDPMAASLTQETDDKLAQVLGTKLG